METTKPCKRRWFSDGHDWQILATSNAWDLMHPPRKPRLFDDEGFRLAPVTIPRPTPPPPRGGFSNLHTRVCRRCGVLDDQIKRFSDSVERPKDPETIFPPVADDGVIVFLLAVPAEERQRAVDDIAEAYAVEVGDDIPGGCIIWGLYRGEWLANVSGRWLVSMMLKRLRAQRFAVPRQ